MIEVEIDWDKPVRISHWKSGISTYTEALPSDISPERLKKIHTTQKGQPFGTPFCEAMTDSERAFIIAIMYAFPENFNPSFASTFFALKNGEIKVKPRS
jgi:hypothetical protein